MACAGNGWTDRHSVLQDTILQLARQVGLGCSREEGLEDQSRPADVLVQSWNGKGPLAIDVSCTHPRRPSTQLPTPAKMRAFLQEAEARKNRKYGDK